jgi:hypothetical protein
VFPAKKKRCFNDVCFGQVQEVFPVVKLIDTHIIASVHFKFKSASDFDSVTFEGGFISCLELKRAIVERKKLGNGSVGENYFGFMITACVVVLFGSVW